MGLSVRLFFQRPPSLKIAYPKALKETKNDDLFEAQVIAQSAKSKNQNFVFPENITDFFTQIATNRQKYTHVRHMIDTGGFLCHEVNRDVAQKWLDSSELDGVIFFKDGTEAYEEKLGFCLKNSPLEIEFSRMEELKIALAQRQLKIDDLKIGVFFDAAHAESAHFDPQAKERCLCLCRRCFDPFPRHTGHHERAWFFK